MFRSVLFFSFLLSYSFSSAQVICPNVGFKEFVKCLAEKHPLNKKNNLLFTQSEGVRDAGSAFSNPELDFETVQGRGLGGRTGNNRIAVSYPFQLFGQRGAKKDIARAEAELLKIEGLKGKSGLLAEVTLNLYRLKHIKDEVVILDDILATYSNVISQLASRPLLSPDQDVTLGVFKLAVGDLAFKKSSLVSEQKKIEDFFSHIQGLTTSQIEKMLPERRKNWPNLNLKKSELAGWPIQQVENQLKLAEAEFDASKAAAWPEVKAGIIYDQEIDSATETSKVGFNVTLPIPLLNWNSGNKQVAASAYQRAIVDKELAHKEVQNERSRTIEFYNSSVETLKKSPNEVEVIKRTKNLASKYSRGLINSTLLIEANRQLFEFKSSQNEIESKTLEALFRIYELDGVSVEEAL